MKNRPPQRKWLRAFASLILTATIATGVALITSKAYSRWVYFDHLTSDDPGRRERGLAYIEQFMNERPQVYTAVCELLATGNFETDLDPLLRDGLIRALVRTKRWNPDIGVGWLKAMMRQAKTGTDHLRAAVAVEIGYRVGWADHPSRYDDQCHQILTVLANDQTPGVRFRALQAAATMPDSIRAELFRHAAQDEHPTIARHAWIMKGLLGDLADLPESIDGMPDEAAIGALWASSMQDDKTSDLAIAAWRSETTSQVVRDFLPVVLGPSAAGEIQSYLVDRINTTWGTTGTDDNVSAWRSVLSVQLDDDARTALANLISRIKAVEFTYRPFANIVNYGPILHDYSQSVMRHVMHSAGLADVYHGGVGSDLETILPDTAQTFSSIVDVVRNTLRPTRRFARSMSPFEAATKPHSQWQRLTDPILAAAISRLAPLEATPPFGVVSEEGSSVHVWQPDEHRRLSELAKFESWPDASVDIDWNERYPDLLRLHAMRVDKSLTLDEAVDYLVFLSELPTMRLMACCVAMDRFSSEDVQTLAATLLDQPEDEQRIAGALLTAMSDSDGKALRFLEQRLELEKAWIPKQHYQLAMWMLGHNEEFTPMVRGLLGHDQIGRTTVQLALLHAGDRLALDDMFDPFHLDLLSLPLLLDQIRFLPVLQRYLPDLPEFSIWGDTMLQQFQADVMRNWYLLNRSKLSFDPASKRFELK